MAASVDVVGWQLDASALPAVPRTYAQQNFTSYYAVNSEGSTRNDLAFRLHANGLCVVALAPSHGALCSRREQAAGAAPAAPPDDAAAASLAAEEIRTDQQTASAAAASEPHAADAQLTFTPKLLQAEFRKGRGPLLHVETILGRLMASGREWVLRCGVRGLLVELNPRFSYLQGAALLRELERSYLAILDVRAAEVSVLAARSLAEPAYQQRLQQVAAESGAGKQEQQRASEVEEQQQQQQSQSGLPPPQQVDQRLAEGQPGGSSGI